MNISSYEFISSKQNVKIKAFAKLSSAKYRKETGLFLAEGIKLSEEALCSGAVKCFLVRAGSSDVPQIKKLLDKSGSDVIKYILSDPVFEKVTTESAPQGIIAVASFPAIHVRQTDAPPSSFTGQRLAALDGIRDPGNFGTILRSAAAFGCDALLVHDCADIYNSKTVRASMGAVFKMKVVFCADLPSYLEGLAREGRRILGAALTDDADDLLTLGLLPSDVPVIGNEGHGISCGVMSACTSFVKIPMTDKAESLNAAVASSVIMWEYSKIGK